MAAAFFLLSRINVPTSRQSALALPWVTVTNINGPKRGSSISGFIGKPFFGGLPCISHTPEATETVDATETAGRLREI